MPAPELLVAGAIVASLILYTLTGGADFGGGVWDLLARGPRAKAQRRAIADAIAPVWEANHVWLIVAVVLLFVCFPTAFAAVSTALHVPITAMLVGVILRGAAFTFRAYDTGPGASERARAWSRVFAITSTVTPVMLGVCAGAVAAGGMPMDAQGRVVTDFVSAWWAPFPFAVGALTLALFAQLAAVYLCVEREDEALAGDFRRRGLVASAAVALCAWVAWVLAGEGAPLIRAGLVAGPGAVAAHVLTGGAGLVTVASLLRRRYRVARVAVMAQAVGVVVGWAAGQHPYLVAPDITVSSAAAPESVLVAVLWALAAGAVLLVPAFWVLYAVFKSRGGAALH